MSDFDVDAFLEHYGVKGMKWGTRKKSSSGGSDSGSKGSSVKKKWDSLTPEQKGNIVTGVAAGAMLAAVVISGNRGQTKASSVSRTPNFQSDMNKLFPGRAAAKTFIKPPERVFAMPPAQRVWAMPAANISAAARGRPTPDQYRAALKNAKLTPDQVARAQRARNAARAGVTPALLGITKPNI